MRKKKNDDDSSDIEYYYEVDSYENSESENVDKI